MIVPPGAAGDQSTATHAALGISVIVPTRNRAGELKDCLSHLATQETGLPAPPVGGAQAGGLFTPTPKSLVWGFTYEVLVVDNGSTDGTRSLVEQLAPDYPVPLRYVYEGAQGKSHALNAGIRLARGRILAFTDDDLVTTSRWLRRLWMCFVEEQADAVTGKILPLWTAERPAWLTDDALRLGETGCLDYGDRRLHRKQRPGHNLRWVGGNLAIRRDVVERVGGYDVRMIRAQDTEYYWRCIRQGLAVVYEPAALAYHTLGEDRMTPEHFRRWRHRTGYYHAYLVPWRKHHLLTIMPLPWYRKTLTMSVRWMRALATRRPWGERFREELRLREAWSVWLHRLQLWPRWALTVITGRSWMPDHHATNGSR